MRFLAVAILIIGTITAIPAAEPKRPLLPTEITWEKTNATLGELTGSLGQQSGIPIEVVPGSLKTKCHLQFDKTPFWAALQQVADQSSTRITLHNGGRKVQLVPIGQSREVATTSGAFRVVAQQVVGRALLDQGITYHEIHLFVHWEPHLRVYRIDSTPAISKATDVPGTKITAENGGSQILPLNSTSEMRVKLAGLNRNSGQITLLAGTFNVTAADRLLAFTFDSSGKLPVTGELPAKQKETRVSASLKRLEKKGDTWEVEVEVTYPPNQPVFESFQGEWWLRDNRLVVRSPAGKSFVIDDYEVPAPDSPRPLRAIYRFKENPNTGLSNPTKKGWSIVYETPSPLAEVKIPFELKDIPLP